MQVAAIQLDSSLVQADVEALRARVEQDWQVRPPLLNFRIDISIG